MYRNLKECFFFGFSFLFSSNILYCNDGENLECRQCLKWILSAHCNWIKPILTVTKRQSYCCCCRFFFSRAIWFGVVFVLATLGLYGIFFQLYISIVWRFFICLLIAAFKIHVLWCFPSRFYHQQRNKLSFRILFLSLSIISGFYFMCVCVDLFVWFAFALAIVIVRKFQTDTKRCPSYVYVEQTCWKVLKTQTFYHLNANNAIVPSFGPTFPQHLEMQSWKKIIFENSYLKRYQFQLVDHWNLMNMSVFFTETNFQFKILVFFFWHTNYGFCLRWLQMIRNDLQIVENGVVSNCGPKSSCLHLKKDWIDGQKILFNYCDNIQISQNNLDLPTSSIKMM